MPYHQLFKPSKMLFTFLLTYCILFIVASSEVEIIFENGEEYDETLNEPYVDLTDVMRTNEKALTELVLKIPELGWRVPLLKDFGREFLKIEANRTNIFNQCNADLLRLTFSITKNWTRGLIDSFGKIPSGLMKGNLLWPGDFDECQSFVSPSSKLFTNKLQGRYCLMALTQENSSNTLSALTTAVCVPRSCSASELNEDYTMVFNLLNKTSIMGTMLTKIPNISFRCLPESVPLSPASIVCIVLIIIITGLTVAGTTYDIWNRYSFKLKSNKVQDVIISEGTFVNDNSASKIELEDKSSSTTINEKGTSHVADFLICFSAITNGRAILDTSEKTGQLNCLHGIRVISMTWVLLGHTYVFGITGFANILDALRMFNDWPFQAISKATFSVDTFFLLSGFLVSYLFLKDRSEFSLKKLGYFYFHRYLRLTPVYLILLFFYGTVFNFIGDGPYWGYNMQESNPCTKYWWRNVFYISNFFNSADMCMAWSWYLDNDMQFFIISPLFLVLFKSSTTKKRFLGLGVVVSLLLASWIYTGVLVKVKNYPVMFNAVGDDFSALLAQGNMFDTIYDKPWTRIGPYLIGCLTAFLLLELGKSRSVFSRITVIICWLGATALALVDVYGLYDQTISISTSAFYNACSRSAWSLSVAWVILACVTNNGGIVDRFLSWKVWFPLSRLTYCTYLVHPMILYFYYQTLRAPIYVTNTVMAIHFLGFTVLSYGLAFVTSIVLEAPVIKLEKLIRQGFSR